MFFLVDKAWGDRFEFRSGRFLGYCFTGVQNVILCYYNYDKIEFIDLYGDCFNKMK